MNATTFGTFTTIGILVLPVVPDSDALKAKLLADEDLKLLLKERYGLDISAISVRERFVPPGKKVDGRLGTIPPGKHTTGR